LRFKIKFYQKNNRAQLSKRLIFLKTYCFVTNVPLSSKSIAEVPTMNVSRDRSVAVVIAVRNAEKTIAEAVSSALVQDAVAEIIVVDDASTDGTLDAVQGANDGTGRLQILEMPRSVGPSKARNIAIAQSKAPLIAILDGDDIFLPRRFDRLLANVDWDFIADNIAMVPDEDVIWSQQPWDDLPSRPETLDLSLNAFISGNLSGRGRRRELGFLKPVMRRSWLERAGIRYNEDVRFAEDYDLYCRALIAGARFKVVMTPGYAARVRITSLSAVHSAADLAVLIELDDALLALNPLSADTRCLIETHRGQVRLNHAYRKLLDYRREQGRLSALAKLAATPYDAPAHIGHFLSDKLRVRRIGTQFDTALLIASPDELRR
jgi:succinoglycan biosynthesis protein ExoU